MKINREDFLRNLAGKEFTNTDRAVAVVWWNKIFENAAQTSIKEIDKVVHSAGYAKQNLNRLSKQLRNDSRTVNGEANAFRINEAQSENVDQIFMPYAGRKEIVNSGSIISPELTAGTRGYIEKVTVQINSSYDKGLYDCCAVMCRRQLETLIIEVYESESRADQLKGDDNHFKMFSGLLSILEADNSISLSRNGMKGLRDFKTLGDLSAHNRRFNASANDIDRIRMGFRVAVEELIHLAKF